MYTALPKSGSPFGPAVTRPGLHIWRVEKLQPVEVPEATWGVFFSGDAYLVLHNGPDERAHLHLWMGRDSSRDEQGACALLSTQLNVLLGERPVTHREVQGNESDVFMEYFPRGVTYQEGGVDSAFKPTRPGTGAGPVRKLYQVKGRKNIRASERGLSWASFNTGDCFILDLGETLFVWCGARCNVLERSRAQELATAIRDGERGGKARLEIVADGEEPPEMLQVLGPKPTLQEGSPEEDVVADQRNAGAAILYKVSDATGRMDLSQVAASSPFSQSLLCSDDCFVLDNGAGGKVYVWKGRKANEQERQAALKVAEEVIARMGYSPQTQEGRGRHGRTERWGRSPWDPGGTGSEKPPRPPAPVGGVGEPGPPASPNSF
ncbi:macrophage-capping protein isoform X2 [Ciconia boyciana]|uniref:macrophage-capping protein isoform X2 n=1 Tax=Ciconia boyciana TaxID=52775 RepID=UPI003BA0ABE3